MFLMFSLQGPETGTCSALHRERGGDASKVRFKFIESWNNISSAERIHHETFNYVTVP